MLPNLKELDISSFEVTNERYIDDEMFSTLPALERLKTPKSFTGASSAILPGVFTDRTNNYVKLDSETPKSTWIERTNLIAFGVLDYSSCGNAEDCGPQQNIHYAEEGMTWTTWMNSEYNTDHKTYTFLNSDGSCPESGYALYKINSQLIPGDALPAQGEISTNASKIENKYKIKKLFKDSSTSDILSASDVIKNMDTYGYYSCIDEVSEAPDE
jgi:hypothetical protein